MRGTGNPRNRVYQDWAALPPCYCSSPVVLEEIERSECKHQDGGWKCQLAGSSPGLLPIRRNHEEDGQLVPLPPSTIEAYALQCLHCRGAAERIRSVLQSTLKSHNNQRIAARAVELLLRRAI